jgi:hypothetical protein
MRTVLFAASAAVLLLLGVTAGQAYYEGPWCAVTNRGGGDMEWNCSMRTFETCRQEVIAGNRGFCNPNPRWQANRPESRPRHSRRRHADD